MEDLNCIEGEYRKATPAKQEEEDGKETKGLPEDRILENWVVQDGLQLVLQIPSWLLSVLAGWFFFKHKRGFCSERDFVERSCFLGLFHPSLSLQPDWGLLQVVQCGHNRQAENCRGESPLQICSQNQHEAESGRMQD